MNLPVTAAPEPTPEVREPAPAKPLETAQPVRTLCSQDLLNGSHEVLIAHGNDTYRLRLTRNGKLILHK